METASEVQQAGAAKTDEQPVRREWDRSEWFRLWLELIRKGSPQSAH